MGVPRDGKTEKVSGRAILAIKDSKSVVSDGITNFIPSVASDTQRLSPKT